MNNENQNSGKKGENRMHKNPLFFSFPIYSDALINVIQTAEKDGAFVVGITGPWGSGKTTLMNTALEGLSKQGYLPIRFNAWAHSKHVTVWRALFLAIVEGLRREVDKRYPKENAEVGEARKSIESKLADAERSLYSAFEAKVPGRIRLDAGKLTKTGLKLGLRLLPLGDTWGDIAHWLVNRPGSTDGDEEGKDGESPFKDKDIDELWGVLRRSTARRQIARVESLEQFRASLVGLLSSSEVTGIKIAVAIDDVDRCLPEQGLQVFEAIKLFLDIPKTTFVIAMDQDVLQHALDLRYRQSQSTTPIRITAELYAEKMLDLTFSIPSPNEESFRSYVRTLPSEALLMRHYDFLKLVLPYVPRTWDRFSRRASLNYTILTRVVSAAGGQVDVTPAFEALFIKLQTLIFLWPRLVRRCGSATVLTQLERSVRSATSDQGAFEDQLARGKTIAEVIRERSTEYRAVPARAWGLVEDRSLVECLASKPFLSESQQTLPIVTLMLAMDGTLRSSEGGTGHPSKPV